MNRRRFLTVSATAAAAAIPAARMLGASKTPEVKGVPTAKWKLTPPATGSIPIAILISEGLNVIDFSGPWGVFESVMVPGRNEMPFRLFTVAEKEEIVISGSGLKLKPDYTFANVPETRVVVIPAQKGSDAMIEWLRKTAPNTDVVRNPRALTPSAANDPRWSCTS